MKVLITSTSLQPAYGGPAFSVSQLATALAQAGAEVWLWSADGSATETPLLPPDSTVRRLQGSVSDAAGAARPDVIHDNGLWLPHNHRIAALAREVGLPRVVSTRGMLEPWAVRHKRWKKAAAWHVYQRRDLVSASALHATAPAEAESLQMLGLGPPISMIPNGVDLPALSPPAPAGPTRTALFLGRIYPVKGLPMLIEAWARVRPVNWRLVIAGPDEAGHQREVAGAVAEAGLEDVVGFAGPVLGGEKTRLLQAVDLFVLPSHSESFGMAAAEAMAAGLPVLTTTAVPWPALETRQCGWRARPTAESLAAALRQATELDSETLRLMGASGRALIAEDYGWTRIAGDFLSLYDRLASSRVATRLSSAAA